MPSTVRRRLFVIVVLTAVGLSVAGVSAAFDLGDALGDTTRTGEINISDDNVTFSDGDREVRLLKNLSTTSDIEVTENGGEIRVRESDDGPLSERERQLAVDIARQNDSVRQYLDEGATAEVEPIRQLDADRVKTTNLTVEAEVETNVSVHSAEQVRVRNVTVQYEDDTVTVDRGPEYVDDEAVVDIKNSETGERRYSVVVNLADERIERVTEHEPH